MTYYKLTHDFCGGVSIYFAEDPRGKTLDHTTAIYPNGVRPRAGGELRCYNCGRLGRAVEEHLYEVTDAEEIKLIDKLLSIE